MRLDRVVVPFEIKAVDDGRVFEGYGSVFGVVDTYADVVAKGAFARTLREKKMPALLWQHDPSKPIGVYESMKEDDTGLYVKGRLSDTQLGREAHTLLKDGALSGLSIGFVTRKSSTDEKTGVRTLTDVDLWETSLVTFPANEAARITGVKQDGILPTEREFEKWLRREAGFTEAEAKTIIAKGYRQVRREAMPSEEACGDLLESVRRLAAVATGADAHGRTDAEGSQGRAR